MSSTNGFPADPAGYHGVRDRGFDPPGRRIRTRRLPPGHEAFQRLVANPFLAFLAVIVWYVAVRQVVLAKRLDLFFPALACLVPVVFLFQFHCLDCGATGRLTRWRDHACEAVLIRSVSGVPRRFRGLTPPAQTVAWFYVLVEAAVIGFIMSR